MADWRVITFWFGVLWIAYVYLGYPVLLALISMVKSVRPQTREDYFPIISVLIAARNEEKDIGWKIRETLDWDYPRGRLEVLVASDASEDKTDEIVSSILDPHVKLFRMSVRCGKSVALNRLASEARGDILFFTDANAHVQPDALRRMVRSFADPRVGVVTGDSSATERGYQEGASSGRGVYWGNELLIRYFENRIGSVLVCDGAIFCVRKELFQPLSPDLANDLELPMRIGQAGFWLLHEPGARVLEKDTASVAEEFSRRRRICAQGVLGVWKLRHTLRGIRRLQFVSHKCLRWLLIVPIVLILISSASLARSSFFFAAILALQIAAYCCALGGWGLIRRGRSPGRVLATSLYIFASVAGAFAGVVDSVRGKRFAVWESPAMSRGTVDTLR